MIVAEPELKDSIVRDIHEHEVFLAFINDADAVAFTEWWHQDGFIAFKQWAKEWSQP